MISYQTILSNQVYLNSSQASTYNNGSLKSNMNFNLKDVISIDKQTLELKISIINAQIPYSFYQINNTNNKFSITISGNTNNYYATLGNYNINTFITMLLGIIPAGFSITYNNSTSKLTFIYTNAFSLLDGTNSLFSIIGFAKGSVFLSVGNQITAPYCYNLSPLNKLNIYTDSFTLNNVDSFNKSQTNILASVPINCSPNDIILYYNFNNYRKNIHNPEQFSNLNIEIYDDWENNIDFNNLDWSLTIQIDVVKEIILNKKSLTDIYEEEMANIDAVDI
jgi:hypothetical protein